MLDALYRTAFRIAYCLHLVWAFVVRPRCEGVWVALWCEGRLLVIRNAYRRLLTLPGGGIDRGEQPLSAAVRELQEEVGLALPSDSLRFVGQYNSDVEYKRDTINVFEAILDQEPSITIDRREVVYAVFEDPKRLSPALVFPALNDYITTALREREGAVGERI